MLRSHWCRSRWIRPESDLWTESTPALLNPTIWAQLSGRRSDVFTSTCEVSYITETHHFDEYGNPAFLPRFAMSCILRMHPNLQLCFSSFMAMLPGKIRITAWTKSDPRTARVARSNLQDVPFLYMWLYCQQREGQWTRSDLDHFGLLVVADFFPTIWMTWMRTWDSGSCTRGGREMPEVHPAFKGAITSNSCCCFSAHSFRWRHLKWG